MRRELASSMSSVIVDVQHHSVGGQSARSSQRMIPPVAAQAPGSVQPPSGM
jgi:hypothetical protein